MLISPFSLAPQPCHSMRRASCQRPPSGTLPVVINCPARSLQDELHTRAGSTPAPCDALLLSLSCIAFATARSGLNQARAL